MKAIKTIFAVLFVSSMFIACEADNINDEVGVEEVETLSTTDGQDAGEIDPEDD